MDYFVNWLFVMMISLVPPVYDNPVYDAVGSRETKEQTEQRFLEIAEVVARVVFDESEKPIFSGPNGRLKTGALLLSIAFWESRYAKHVDFGRDSRGRLNIVDSWCMMQINLGKKKIKNPQGTPKYIEDSAIRTAEGWSGLELLADREKCFRAGLHIIGKSWGCGPDINDALTNYASGKCVHARNVNNIEGGAIIREKSAQRVGTALRYFERNSP